MDVGAETLDARIGQDGAWRQFARDADGITGLAAFRKTHAADIVVMEATGGYERLPVAQLRGAARPLAIVDPRAVRRIGTQTRSLEAKIAEAIDDDPLSLSASRAPARRASARSR